jgi:hypothetical protein
MTSIVKVSDPRLRTKVAVSSVPAGVNEILAATVSVPAGTIITISVTTTPESDDLSLWDFLFSFYIDVDAYTNIFSGGSALTAAQRKFRLSQWVDWADSSDRTNTRCHKIRMENYDVSDHTLYLKYKAYTFSTVTGASA